jgi:hypothetical protein
MGNLRWGIPSKGEIFFSPVKLLKRNCYFCSSRIKKAPPAGSPSKCNGLFFHPGRMVNFHIGKSSKGQNEKSQKRKFLPWDRL